MGDNSPVLVTWPVSRGGGGANQKGEENTNPRLWFRITMLRILLFTTLILTEIWRA